MGKGSRKSRRRTSYCSFFDTENAADKCRKKPNDATKREGLCIPCWQKKNAKLLNQRHNMWSREGLKKRLMVIPIQEWPEVI